MSETNGAYPQASWTVEEIREALTDDGDGNVPTYDDAARWRAIANDPLTGEFADDIVERAERRSDEPTPQLPATLYADYGRTGNRSRYERAYFGRNHRLALFALAECLEREGVYLDDILDEAWAICEQTTWLLPAHLPDDERREGLPTLRASSDHHVALFSARTALLLAELDHLLGKRLHPAFRTRIRTEIDDRVLTPFEKRDGFHWRQPPTGNWSAVCHAGAVTAALYVEEDTNRLARLVVKAVRGLEHYLESFGSDGCTPEGLLYWNFGFSHYAMLAAALEARTDGELSLLTPPILQDIARFPLRTVLSPGRYVPFSDSRETGDADPYLACWVGDKLDVPGLVAEGRRALRARNAPFSQRPSDSLMETVRNLDWCHRAPSDVARATPSRSYLYEDTEWWFARADPADPDGLVVAVKAGHNDEHHNHNDCGSFVVHYRGESSLTDLGSGTYDRNYFSDRRYESLTARSLGHSVPFVDGYEQSAGREYAADVVDHAAGDDADRFAVELADCYPSAAGVSSLRRTVALDRAAEQVTVTDAAAFDAGVADPDLESVLVSYVPVRETEEDLVIEGDRSRTRVAFDPTPDRVDVERLHDAVGVSSVAESDADDRDVWRIRVAPPVVPDETAELRTTIAPKPLD